MQTLYQLQWTTNKLIRLVNGVQQKVVVTTQKHFFMEFADKAAQVLKLMIISNNYLDLDVKIYVRAHSHTHTHAHTLTHSHTHTLTHAHTLTPHPLTRAGRNDRSAAASPARARTRPACRPGRRTTCR